MSVSVSFKIAGPFDGGKNLRNPCARVCVYVCVCVEGGGGRGGGACVCVHMLQCECINMCTSVVVVGLCVYVCVCARACVRVCMLIWDQTVIRVVTKIA